MRHNEKKPERMIGQNRYLRRFGIYGFSIPALAGKLPDGRKYVTCPTAGVCARACYARAGTYKIPSVLAKHQRNLTRILDNLPQWEADMLNELSAAKFNGAALRVHDAGDFFSTEYLLAWLRIARASPSTLFYCYTKEISRFREHVEPDPPPNFLWVFSFGGREDHLIDINRDRVADVFPDEEAIARAGWFSNAASDLDAVLSPSRKVGMAQNNIPHLRRRIGNQTFRDWQASKRRSRDVSRAAAHSHTETRTHR